MPDSVKKQEISGKDLANKVSMMLKYIENYEKNSKSLENLSTSIQQAVDNMDKVMESFDYLRLIFPYSSGHICHLCLL